MHCFLLEILKLTEITFRPWEWPINLRGQFFSGNDHRVYLLGNPIVWWGNLLFLAAFLVLFSWQSVVTQRQSGSPETLSTPPSDGKYENPPPGLQTVTLDACLWLFVGWALHYIPFWAMGRVLYFHHYFPGLLNNSSILCLVKNH